MSNGDLKNNEKERAIIKIIAFFDLFDYPLSAWEIKKNLSGVDFWGRDNLKLSELGEVLKLIIAAGYLQSKNGFYFLPGREAIVAIRQRRYNYSKEKIKIARRYARVFKILPFVKMISLVNSIGAYNLKDEGDIDFFIITAPRRIWLARLFCTGLAQILHSRPNKKTKRNKICLSFYLDEEHLSLKELKLQGGDPYFDFWEKNLIVLFDRGRVYDKFLWCNSLSNIPLNGLNDILNNGEDVASINQPERHSVLRAGGNLLEKLSARFQLGIMPLKLRQAAGLVVSAGGQADNSGVMITNYILKLYLSDRRAEIKEKYEKKIRQLL
jgi:hypothetical protein